MGPRGRSVSLLPLEVGGPGPAGFPLLLLLLPVLLLPVLPVLLLPGSGAGFQKAG